MANKERQSAERFHPGEFIKDEIEARGWNVEDIAKIAQVDPTAVREIISGYRRVTPIFAIQLGKAFGVSREFFDNLQKAYDAAGDGNG